jgi:hypothetical protein
MIHRINERALASLNPRKRWIEIDARELMPRHRAEACDNARRHDRDLGVEMFAAVVNFNRTRISIASVLVARIASHQVGDEYIIYMCELEHASQQDARTISGKRNSSKVAAEAPGCDADEHHLGRNRAVAGYHSRSAFDQRRTLATLQHRGSQRLECGLH